MNNNDDVYLQGAKILDIIALYKFDMELSSIFSKYILECERHIVSVFAYYCSEELGPEGYLDFKNYNHNKKEKILKIISKLLSQISGNRSKEVKHYLQKYNSSPFWVIINKLQLGEIKNIYEYSNFNIKLKVAKHFIKNSNYTDNERVDRFVTYFKSIYYSRNKVSHNNKFFNIRDHKYQKRPEITIKPLDIHKTLENEGIFKKGGNGNYLRGVNDIVAIIFSIREILGKTKMKKLLSEIDDLLNESYFGILKVHNVKEKMGIPKDISKLLY